MLAGSESIATGASDFLLFGRRNMISTPNDRSSIVSMLTTYSSSSIDGAHISKVNLNWSITTKCHVASRPGRAPGDSKRAPKSHTPPKKPFGTDPRLASWKSAAGGTDHIGIAPSARLPILWLAHRARACNTAHVPHHVSPSSCCWLHLPRPSARLQVHRSRRHHQRWPITS